MMLYVYRVLKTEKSGISLHAKIKATRMKQNEISIEKQIVIRIK